MLLITILSVYAIATTCAVAVLYFWARHLSKQVTDLSDQLQHHREAIDTLVSLFHLQESDLEKLDKRVTNLVRKSPPVSTRKTPARKAANAPTKARSKAGAKAPAKRTSKSPLKKGVEWALSRTFACGFCTDFCTCRSRYISSGKRNDRS